MRSSTLLLALLAVTPLTRVTAQERTTVEPGTRVRVTAPHVDIVRHTGTLARIDADTLVVGARAIAVEWVTRLEVVRGQKSHLLQGMGIGLLAGAAVGAVAIASSGDLDNCDPFSPTTCVLIGAGLGAAVGIPVGALIGLAVRTDRWEEVPLDQLRVSFGPQRAGRFGLGFSVAF